MGITNTTVQIKTGFFHALGKVLSLDTNLIGNENYKSAHNVSTKEIWVDSISFSEFYSDAINESTINNAVTIIGGSPSTSTLFPLANTNYQTWFFDIGIPSVLSNGFIPSDQWVKPIINPSDVTNSSGAPSNGFSMRMYRDDGTTLISYDNAFYEVDYFSGLIKFQPGATPIDPSSSSGLGFQLSQSGFESAASISYASAVAYLDTNGPKGVSFQYTGEFLDTYLNNISGNSGNSGSNEWQSSVNGYLTEIGNNEIINGLIDINDQIEYMNLTYEKYFILTDDDITGVTWSGIIATNSYYEFNGSTFSSYTLTDLDDSNRFLLMENTITLDTIVISSTGSVTEFPSTIIQPNSILEYTNGLISGLTYSTWQVTNHRLGMVTTLDNKSNKLVRYIGSTWTEYQYELTYKVNSQKDIESYTTDTDYDIAIKDVLEYEPSGDKSVDVLVNGVEMPSDVYIWGNPSVEVNMSIISSGTNTITVSNIDAPTIGQYIRLNNGSDYLRQVINVITTGTSLVTYSGVSVSSVTTSWKFTITPRSSRVAKKGDYLLWIGSGWYELTESIPKDLITLEYVTMNDGAMYS